MDNIQNPAHYTIYPVQPIEITRHLGFCLGNATKYVLRAPYKGAVEDCLKALRYLEIQDVPPEIELFAPIRAIGPTCDLIIFLRESAGDILWKDISQFQIHYLDNLLQFLNFRGKDEYFYWQIIRRDMKVAIGELRRVLSLRDTTGQIYEGMTGLPGSEND